MKKEDYTQFVAQVEGYLNFQNEDKALRSHDIENILAMCSPHIPVKECRSLVRKLIWLITYLVCIKNRKINMQYLGRIEMAPSRSERSEYPVLKHRKTFHKDLVPFKKKYGKEG